MTAPDIGVYVYSKTRRHPDGDETWPGSPLAGVIIDTYLADDPETGERQEKVKVVESHRGDIFYHHLTVDDLDVGMSGGHVMPAVIRDLGLALNRDSSRKRDPNLHLSALVAMSVAAAQRTTTTP